MICEGTKKIGNNEIDIPIGRSSNWRLTKRPRCSSNFQEAMGFNPIYMLYMKILSFNLYVSKLISFKLIDNQ
jgi:hypothetical protein